MKYRIAFALLGLLSATSGAIAQLPAGGVQPQTGGFYQPTTTAQVVQYGAVARPAANVRKPAAVASVPTRSPQVSGQAVNNSFASTNHATTVRQPVRTAQASYAGPMAAPMPVADSGSIGGTVSGSTGGCSCSGGGSEGGCGGGCDSCGMGRCGRRGLGSCRVPFWRSTGDMPQHMPYFPNAHGYYYFRPYNAVHVNQQQEMVTRWGLDPRNPADNRFFERIYQEQETAQLQDTVSTPHQQPMPMQILPR